MADTVDMVDMVDMERHAPGVTPRGRFAPTPSGRLHLGNARTALLCWLQMRRLEGTFILRIEDVDAGRCRPALEAIQIADLDWLGLDWDEGPGAAGTVGPYRQSARLDRYAEAASLLETFPCSCTRRELQAMSPRSERYDLRCLDGPVDPSRPLALRWRPPAGAVSFEDEVAGQVSADLRRELGAAVVRRTDGVWSYQLAVALDDLDMGITHVLRGEDLLGSTARQLALMSAVASGRGQPFRAPRYAHVPIVYGPDGRKLSKRHGAPDLETLRRDGAHPEAVVAYLARSAGLVGDQVRRVRPASLVEAFDLQNLRQLPTRLEGTFVER